MPSKPSLAGGTRWLRSRPGPDKDRTRRGAQWGPSRWSKAALLHLLPMERRLRGLEGLKGLKGPRPRRPSRRPTNPRPT